MTIERRYKGGFDVYIPSQEFGRLLIDKVFYDPSTVDEVRRSLIDHDGYDSNIIVEPPSNGLVPLTDREIETVCEDYEIKLTKNASGNWDWRSDGYDGINNFASQEDALDSAMDSMGYGVEFRTEIP